MAKQVTSICPGSETTKTELWSGKWILVKGKIEPDLRLMPIGKTITGDNGVGHWLGKGYKLPEDVPVKDDGSWRIPPGIAEGLQATQKEAQEFIDKELAKQQKPEQTEQLGEIVTVITNLAKVTEGLVTRIEKMEDERLQDNRKNARPVQKRKRAKKSTDNGQGN